MAEMNLGGSTENSATSIPNGITTNETIKETDTSVIDASAPNVQVNKSGMSSEELNDANKIKVTIADYKTPLVIFLARQLVVKR